MSIKQQKIAEVKKVQLSHPKSELTDWWLGIRDTHEAVDTPHEPGWILADWGIIARIIRIPK
jgi:hypothetical protein